MSYIDNIQQEQLEQYLVYEYFICLLPCYLVLLTAAIRCYQILDLPIKYKLYTFENALESYKIKYRLSQLMVATYLLSLFLGLASSPRLFWASQLNFNNLFYIFGVIAWVDTIFLLQVEYVRGLNQSIFVLRIFWILSFGLSVVRFFIYSQGIFDLIIHVTRLISTFVLFLYGILKPYDQPYIEQNGEKQNICNKFFNSFEKNEFIGYILNYRVINHQTWKDINQPLIVDAIEMKQLSQGCFQMTKLSDENEQTAEDLEHYQ
ncbi:hypothetical protein ABPG74_009557, partial [Tetrahymena malaccensis]